MAHAVLYTADRLISFGYSIPSACFCSFPSECPQHFFFHCPLAQSGISLIQSLLYGASPMAPVIGERHLLFGFSTAEFRHVLKIFAYLLNVCKFIIWCQRNDFRFRAERPSALRLLACLKSRTCFYQPLIFKRFPSNRRRSLFASQWGGNGVLGVVSADRFELCL